VVDGVKEVHSLTYPSGKGGGYPPKVDTQKNTQQTIVVKMEDRWGGDLASCEKGKIERERKIEK